MVLVWWVSSRDGDVSKRPWYITLSIVQASWRDPSIVHCQHYCLRDSKPQREARGKQ